MQLKYFRKALETGNITRAAAELNVAQTALGMQIRNLEQELGVELLERHSRGVKATECGALLARYAEEIFDKVEEARRAVRKLAGESQVSLHMGITPSIMRLVGDAILTDLDRLIPSVDLKMVEGLSFILMRQLAANELSCALTYAPEIDARLEKRALLEEDLMFLTAPDVGGAGDTIPFREVVTSELAMTAREDAIFGIVDHTARRLGLSLNPVYEVQSIRAVKNLVEKGIAATIMPYGAAEGELRKGSLRGRLIVAPTITRTLMFAYPRHVAPMVETPSFSDFLDKVCERLIQTKGPVLRRL